jgi:hypothetical protein
MGSLFGIVFVLWIIGYMTYSLWQNGRPAKIKHFNVVENKTNNSTKPEQPSFSDDGSFKLFLKTVLLPIILVVFLGIAVSQCEGGSGKTSSSSNSGWWKTNSCGTGAKFDEFNDGRGQWRNPDGKFCSR